MSPKFRVRSGKAGYIRPSSVAGGGWLAGTSENSSSTATSVSSMFRRASSALEAGFRVRRRSKNICSRCPLLRAISVRGAGDRRHVGDVQVPREEDPGVLAHFGDEGV